ncbi:MAG TPA: dCTP deaminase [Vicinamibacterales bacterium]|nr:dCTP deaminase [Vicinamibacterales bacterium]
MILSDREIERALRQRLLVIKPPPSAEQFTTSALDLRLGDEMFEQQAGEAGGTEPAGVETHLVVDPGRVDLTSLLRRYARPLPKQADGSFILPPGKFALGITHEWIELPRRSKIAARVEGRSTLARLGLVVHLTAPTVHAGFAGNIVLEMYNFGNYSLRLRPRSLAICQIVFERLGTAPKGPLRTRFAGQRSVR